MFFACWSGSGSGAFTCSTVGVPDWAQPGKKLAAARKIANEKRRRVIGSVFVARSLIVDRNTVVASASELPGGDVDIVADKPHRAVAHDGVNAAGMETAGGNHAVAPVVRAAGAARTSSGWILPIRRRGG